MLLIWRLCHYKKAASWMTARTQTKVEISLKSINFVFKGGSNRGEISQQCGNKTHIVKKQSIMSACWNRDPSRPSSLVRVWGARNMSYLSGLSWYLRARHTPTKRVVPLDCCTEFILPRKHLVSWSASNILQVQNCTQEKVKIIVHLI